MTANDQRINAAIADSLGWVCIIYPDQDEYHFLSTKELEELGGKTAGRNINLFPDGLHHELPDYLHSDAACRDMLESLSEDERKEFVIYLQSVVQVETGKPWYKLQCFDLLNATARQKSEAFCRVKCITWEVGE